MNGQKRRLVHSTACRVSNLRQTKAVVARLRFHSSSTVLEMSLITSVERGCSTHSNGIGLLYTAEETVSMFRQAAEVPRETHTARPSSRRLSESGVTSRPDWSFALRMRKAQTMFAALMASALLEGGVSIVTVRLIDDFSVLGYVVSTTHPGCDGVTWR